MNAGNDGSGQPSAEWAMREETARTWVRGAVRSVRSLVETTLGPRGMAAVVETVDHQDVPETVVTTDAGVLFDAIERGDGFNHPVAALFVDGVDSMRRHLHDGTTTAVLLSAALVERGSNLVEEGVPPASVAVGYAMAASRAGAVLDDLSRPVAATDEETLALVAATSMTVDLDPDVRERYARRVAETVAGLAATGDGSFLDTDYVTVRAATGVDERLVRGHVVRRRPGQHEELDEIDDEFDWSPAVPGRLTNATVAVLDRAIDVEETATGLGTADEAGVRLDSTDEVQRYVRDRDARIAAVADRIADLGVDVLVSQAELDRAVRAALDARGVAVLDRVQYPASDVHRVARATGARVVSHAADLSAETLGTAGQVSERRVGEEKWATFAACSGDVFTLVARGDTAGGVELRERLLADAVEVTAVAAMDGQLLPGASAPALAVAEDVRAYAPSVSGKEQLAVAAFAEAVEDVVTAFVRNAGADPLDAITALRAAHADATGHVGFDPERRAPFDPVAAGVLEPRRVFSQAVDTAVAVAEDLLSVDAVLYPGVDLGAFAPETEHD